VQYNYNSTIGKGLVWKSFPTYTMRLSQPRDLHIPHAPGMFNNKYKKCLAIVIIGSVRLRERSQSVLMVETDGPILLSARCVVSAPRKLMKTRGAHISSTVRPEMDS
jgi:hypothetical protein